ncbi:MAG: hypothetical protein EOO71_31380 [Myxococcaceae bacterium]|nr:MAG: hypothetical protein EOO71_31380 [Myxococcaceae bacterium]
MKRTSAIVLGLSLSLASMGAFAAAPKAAKGTTATQAKSAAKAKKAKQPAGQKPAAAPAESTTGAN